MVDTPNPPWVSSRTRTSPRIAYDRAGSGPPIVFLHGVGSDRRTWRAQAPLAAERGVSLVAWDARGYGLSELTASFTLDACADDLARLLDELGVESAALVGHSMGGLVAQQFACSHPTRVQSLALVSTTPSLRGALTDAQVEAFLAERCDPVARGVPMADIAARIAPRLVAAGAPAVSLVQAVEMMASLDAAAYVRALEAVTRYPGVPALSAIRVPALVVVGALDTLTPPAAARALARGIAGAQLHVLPGIGHMLPLEAPAALNALLAEFFGRVPPVEAARAR